MCDEMKDLDESLSGSGEVGARGDENRELPKVWQAGGLNVSTTGRNVAGYGSHVLLYPKTTYIIFF